MKTTIVFFDILIAYRLLHSDTIESASDVTLAITTWKQVNNECIVSPNRGEYRAVVGIMAKIKIRNETIESLGFFQERNVRFMLKENTYSLDAVFMWLRR